MQLARESALDVYGCQGNSTGRWLSVSASLPHSTVQFWSSCSGRWLIVEGCWDYCPRELSVVIPNIWLHNNEICVCSRSKYYSSPNSSSELETTGTMTMENKRCAQSYTVKSNLTYVLFVMWDVSQAHSTRRNCLSLTQNSYTHTIVSSLTFICQIRHTKLEAICTCLHTVVVSFPLRSSDYNLYVAW